MRFFSQGLMMKIAVVLTCLSVQLCPGASAQTAELKFTTQDFAPFNYLADGRVAGPAADIIREVCQQAQLQCSFRLLPWRRAQYEVRQGQANGMFVIGWNPERAKWLYFSHPLLITEYGFFVRQQNPLVFKSAGDIKGYRIGVYGPSNTATSLLQMRRHETDFRVEMRPDDESGFRKLDAGRLQAVYSNRDVGFALIRQFGLKHIRYAGTHKKLPYYIGFSRQFTDKALVEHFNEVFLRLYKKGDIQDILERYHMVPAPIESPNIVQPAKTPME